MVEDTFCLRQHAVSSAAACCGLLVVKRLQYRYVQQVVLKATTFCNTTILISDNQTHKVTHLKIPSCKEAATSAGPDRNLGRGQHCEEYNPPTLGNKPAGKQGYE